MTMRLLLWLMVLCLALPGWAAVLPDGAQIPASDPDAPAALIPATVPGGAPQRVQVGLPAEKAAPAGSPIGGSSTSAPPASSSAANASKSGTATGAAPATPSPAATDLRNLVLPNGQPVPWSLVALAVLLFLFSVGGGVYFWRTRDE